MATGQEVGVWEGLYSAIADELYLMAGNLLVRTAATYVAGAGTITVEGTDRWPDAGRFVVNSTIGLYTGKTNTTFTGVTDALGNPGLSIDVRTNSPLMDISRENTQLDDLRASFIVPEAEEGELDTLARNYGIFRPRGLSDTLFRDLLQVWIYLEAQTIYGCEQILDIVFGPGNYDLYEDLESEKHKVFVNLPETGGSTVFQGKAFVVGGEAQDTTGAFTVDVDNPVRNVYGCYLATDPFRVGTNFANLDLVVSTAAASPDRLASAALFLLTDEGRFVVIDGTEHWVVLEFVSTSELRLGWQTYTDATLDSASPDEIEITQPRFQPWMVGHAVVISGSTAGNDGTFTIAEILSPFKARLTAAAFAIETDVTWTVIPQFGTAGGLTGTFLRATAVGNTITLPVTPGASPVAVLVDYTHVLSAQALLNQVKDGNDQFPFYLHDDTAIAQFILDLITAAGVEVVVELI
jgi:hypothetical protein